MILLVLSYHIKHYHSQENAKVFTSSPAPGFKALSSAPEEVEAKIVAKLGEILHYLSSSVKEGGRRRAVLLWGLKCWLLTGGKHSCLSALPQLLSDFSGRRDVRGLLEDPAVLELQVSALSEAITMTGVSPKEE